jgi:multidrug efflux pump subunit AcrA (membrane-fusion protein)
MVRISSLAENSTPLEGTHFDQLPVIDPQTQQVGILVTVNQPATNRLIPGEVVQATLMGNEKLTGLKLPASAVLRYEGKGWVYVQSDTNQFVRIEVPLERELDAGYFIEKELSATNRIIVTGAQSVLSAELGGGFTTGERD